MSNRRKGFSIVELLVVVLVGTLLVLATLQVLITNRRTYTVQNAALQNQQQLRASLEVLLAELRQVSSRGGDILEAESDRILVRSMDDIGIICNVTWNAGTLQSVTYHASDPAQVFTTSDSLLVFADNNSRRSDDDAWVAVTAGSVNGPSGCDLNADGIDELVPTADLSFSTPDATALTDDSVSVGAPIRDFVIHEWSTVTESGDIYLARSVAGGASVPVVGPLMPAGRADTPTPLSFRYLDATGTETTTTTDVRQIEVTVHTWSPVVGDGGNNVQNSLVLPVNTRN